ncbi:MAG: glycosyltransferase family 2 protein [Thermoguttaceae bacterium]|nr:glycosyltransferase family 2 protein [Thermoguttaceae bacterium]
MNRQISQPLLTVIIPIYNEEKTLQRILARVVVAEPHHKQIIIVDDCSTDCSRKILKSWEKRPNVLVLFHENNQGKGSSIRTALPHAVGKYTLIQDVDLEYNPDDYMRLLEPMVHETADVVYGSRSLGRIQGNVDRIFWNPFRVCVAMLDRTVQILYRRRVTDEATCYKLFRAKTLLKMQLQCRRFEFCPEVTAKTFRMGLRLVEIPIHYSPRKCNEGKKIGIRDAIEAFYTLWRWRNWTPH